jgi:hypothetical protein
VSKRALLIGSQTGGLRGVHADVLSMRDALAPFGFAATVVLGESSTSDGIRAAYRALVEDTTAGDAVVVYYSGHGARFRTPHADPRWLQYLVPVDLASGPGQGFRGILAEELSLLQWELTSRTANVTTILDCCHAARMSRDPALLPKTPVRPHAVSWSAVRAEWQRLRGGFAADGNPSAVRLVACGAGASAYELPADATAGPRGALTSALVRVLRQPGSADLSWRELIGLVRPTVACQRPDVEGPADRYLFGTAEKSSVGVLPVLVEDGVPYLAHPALFGIAVGDRYDLVAVGGDARRPVARGVVTHVLAERARLTLVPATPALPPHVEAHPVEIGAGRQPVSIQPHHARIAGVLLGSPHLRLAGSAEQPVATVRLTAGEMEVLDRGGEPLTAGRLPLTEDSIGLVRADVLRLARAEHIRSLPSGKADDVDVACTLLGADEELCAGVHLFVGDRVVLRVKNHSGHTRHVTVLDIGLRGDVTLLTTSEPSGVAVEDGETYELYRLPVTNALDGIELFWPDGLPAGGARRGTFVIVSMNRPEDLAALAQGGTLQRSPVVRDLVADEPQRWAGELRYQVQRFDFYLHPQPRPDEEPTFAVDERPHLSFRLVPPRPTEAVPDRIQLRLVRCAIAGADRLDVLVVTRSADRRLLVYRTVTVALLGGRLPSSGHVVFSGVATDLVELAIWASPAGGPALADLLTGDRRIETATAARFVGAVARLTRKVARLLPEATGVCRASLLSCDRFGAGTHEQRRGTGTPSVVYQVTDLA